MNIDLKVITEGSEPQVRYEQNPSTGREGGDSPILYDAPLKAKRSNGEFEQLAKECQVLRKQKDDLYEQLRKMDDEMDKLQEGLEQEKLTLNELRKSVADFFSAVSTSEEKEKKAVTQLCRLLGFDELRIQAVFKSFKKKKGFF